MIHVEDDSELDICTISSLRIPFEASLTVEDKLKIVVAHSIVYAEQNHRLYSKFYWNVVEFKNSKTFPSNRILNNGTCGMKILETWMFMKAQGTRFLMFILIKATGKVTYGS